MDKLFLERKIFKILKRYCKEETINKTKINEIFSRYTGDILTDQEFENIIDSIIAEISSLELNGDSNSKIDFRNSLIRNIKTDFNLTYQIETNSWDEFKDKNFSDWKRVFDAIKHENTLLNQRITWLFSSQAFLFTAFTLAYIQFNNLSQSTSENQAVQDVINNNRTLYIIFLALISIFGVLISIYIWRSSVGAIRQLRELENWWHFYRHDESIECDTTDPLWVSLIIDREHKTRTFSPPLRAKNKYWQDRYINTERIPILFGVVWSAIIIGTGLFKTDQIISKAFVFWKESLIVLLIIFIIFQLIQSSKLKSRVNKIVIKKSNLK